MRLKRPGISPKTFCQFLEAVGSRTDKWSWSWHPHHGIRVEAGYHRHDEIEAENPEVYEDPENPGSGWYPPAGFAKVNHTKREIEFHDYSGKPNPDAVEALKYILGLKNYRVVPARPDTVKDRKDEDWI